MEGDATHLPFEGQVFDVVISNTVQEHIEPTAFWSEQLRVLKPGGVCLCLSSRKGIQCTAPCLEMTAEEKNFWDSIPRSDDGFEKHAVGRYWLSEAELPASMEKNGFSDVSTGYVLIDLTPDAPKYSSQMAETMIEAMRQNDLEAIQSVHCDNAQKAIAAVNAKYDHRIRLYQEGIKQWDTSVSVTMIVRGRKSMNARDELIQLKENTGMSWKKLSEYYGIPYRTVQDWYMGKRRMPEYLLRLMIFKAEIEIIRHSITKGADDSNGHESR